MFLRIFIASIIAVHVVNAYYNQIIPKKSSIIRASKDIMTIEFLPDDKKIECKLDEKLSDVALRANVEIPYKCRKGECGTCEVKVAGKWIRTCQSTIADVSALSLDPLNLSVTKRKQEIKKPSKFFSPASFAEGVYNNGLGVFGFVVNGLKEDTSFQQRMQKEKELQEKIAQRKKQ